MEEKTIEFLNSKWWYRFLKVIYIWIIVVVLILSNFLILNISRDYNWYTNIYTFNLLNFIKYLLVGNFIILSFFEVIRKSFYYIVLGKINPNLK